MKKINLLALCAIIIGGLLLVSCGGNTATPKASLKNDVDSVSYAYGVTLADQGLAQFLEQSGIIKSPSGLEYEYQMKMSGVDSLERADLEKELKTKLDNLNKENAPKLDQFMKGLKEALNGGDKKTAYIQGLSVGNQISEQMMPQLSSMVFAADTTKKMNTDQILSGLFGSLRNQELAISSTEAASYVEGKVEEAQHASQLKADELTKAESKDIIEEGETFLAENAEKEGVILLPSGLQYEVIKEGKGEMPVDGDLVKVHYHGTLIDGTVFDSSIDRGEPQVLDVNGVIAGWTEALKLMPVGSKWKLYIPNDLAYGAQGAGADIKPYSAIVFDVELISIEKK